MSQWASRTFNRSLLHAYVQRHNDWEQYLPLVLPCRTTFQPLEFAKRSRYSNRAVIALYSNRTVMVIVRAFGIQYQYSYYTG